jgi:hypothetical protein
MATYYCEEVPDLAPLIVDAQLAGWHPPPQCGASRGFLWWEEGRQVAGAPGTDEEIIGTGCSFIGTDLTTYYHCGFR